MTGSLPASYFDALYAASPDPWGFTDRWYEARKRALTLALLPEPRYQRAYEPGCSIGVLTAELAPRCASLLAVDVSAPAVTSARERCADLPQVEVRHGGLLERWPDGDLDLVVLSEVLYYLDATELDAVASRAAAAGTVVAVHWRHPVRDYLAPGDEVHARLATGLLAAGLTSLARYQDADLVAEVWSRDGRSVGERGGLT